MSDILIFKFGALGDVIMATPLVKAIIKSTSGSSCTLVTTDPFVSIFKNWDNLQIKILDNKSFVNNFELARSIRKKSYARLFDLQGNDRSRMISFLSGIPEKIGNHRFPNNCYPKQRWKGQIHIFERMCEVLETAGVLVEEKSPCLPASGKQVQRIEKWMAQQELERKTFALLHAGSSKLRQEKRWPYFGDLAEKLTAQGILPVWVGGKEEIELNRKLSLRSGLDTTGMFDIVELAELGRHAAFAVTNDSGPMHILSASNIPVFGLFGPSSKNRNHAIGQKERALSVEELEGLNSTFVENSRITMNDLPLKSVWKKLELENLLVN